jgi:ketosteroid isomerase-like protein
MKRLLALASIAVVLGGCTGRKKKEEAPETIEQQQMRPGTTLTPQGSAGSAGSAAATMEPVKALAGADLAKRVDECWSFRSDAKWPELAACYAPDAVVEVTGAQPTTYANPTEIVGAAKSIKQTFPDAKGEVALALVDGKRVTAVVLYTGTNTGTDPQRMTQPTGKKFGGLVAQVFDFDDAGRIKHVAEYFDLATLLGQIYPVKDKKVRAVLDKAPMAKEVVIAKGDDAEKANVAAIANLDAAFAKRDANAVGAMLADDAKWSELAQPTDWTKKEFVANLPKLWKAFPDLATTSDAAWSVGDYVVARETTKLTKDGPAIPMLVVYKLAGGKIAAAWSFFQSPPPAAPPTKPAQ